MQGVHMTHPLEDLATQLQREHYGGMAADRLEAEAAQFGWDIEGWADDVLKFYIAGAGLFRIPLDQVEAIGQAFLAEAQFMREGGDL